MQRQALDSILCLINVEASEQKQTPGSQLAIADVDSQQSAAEAAPTPSPLSTKSQTQTLNPKALPLDLNSIFDGVLEQKSDDEENDIKITYFNKKSTGASSSKAGLEVESPSPQKRPMFMIHMTEEEKKLMQSASEAPPIARDGKSQNQRINAIAPKPKKKAKGKKKNDHKKGDTEKMKKDEDQEHTPAPMKRPSAAPSTLGLADEEDEEKLKERIPEGIVEAAVNLTKDLDPAEVTREVRRQRTTSNAYHRSEVLLMKQGMSKEDAQAVGRVAGRLAGAEFDKLCPSARSKAKAKSKAKPKATAPKKKSIKDKKKTKKTAEEELESNKIKETDIPEEVAMNDEKKEPEDVD